MCSLHQATSQPTGEQSQLSKLSVCGPGRQQKNLKTVLAQLTGTFFVKANNNNIDKLSKVVTDYINYCTENIVPTKRVKCFANNKPWLTKGLKTILNEKKEHLKKMTELE